MAVDLYSGAGGSSLGLMLAGFRIAGALDCDPAACRTYARNTGVRPLCARLEEIEPGTFLKHFGLDRGDIDVLVGCPPCQGFSQANRRAGTEDDPRNRQVILFAGWVREVMPRAVVFENVPGILRHGRRHFRALLAILRGGGYRVAYRVLDAADYGVPQRRKRLVAVALRHDVPGEFRFPPPRPCSSVRDAIGDLPPLRAGERDPRDPNHVARRLGKRTLQLIRAIPKDGGSRKNVPASLWLRCHRAGRGHEDVFGRLRWDDVAPTITSGCTDPTKGRYVHPEQDRAITPREALCLQSFPRDYVFEGTVVQVSRQIGNAFPPLLMREIARCIAAAIGCGR